MANGRSQPEANTSKTHAPLLELHLSRDEFATGRHLSGVVVLQTAKPTGIRSISVLISGRETPRGASLSRGLRRTSSFFDREVLLSGKEQPRFASERVAMAWNAFLGRESGRVLSPGEHTYPFAIPLPASLPPSYDGRAGRIDYAITARVQFNNGRVLKVTRMTRVIFVPRAGRAQPVALSYPTAGGTFHTAAVSVNLTLPDRAVQLGGRIVGRLVVSNPKGAEINGITASLETVEWVRLTTERELQRQCVDSVGIEHDDPTASEIAADFELSVPEDANPTVEGTAISVIWFLKMSLKTDPPLELKTPITICAPEVDGDAAV